MFIQCVLVIAKLNSDDTPSAFSSQTPFPSRSPTESPKTQLRESRSDLTVVPSSQAENHPVVPDIKPSGFKTPMKVEATVNVERNTTKGWAQALRYAKSLLTEEDLYVPFEYNCTLHFGEKECAKGDPRPNYVYKYHTHNTKEIYLIVINHHWNILAALPFFRNNYFRKFAELFNSDFDVVYLAPDPQPAFTVCAHGLRVGGEYSYYTLTVAYQLFHDLQSYKYAGYFLMNDDAFLDPLYLNTYNLSESHHEPTRTYNPRTPWPWNSMKNMFGVPYPQALRDAVEEVVAIPALERVCRLSDPENTRRSLQDYFYVSKDDIALFVKLSSIFYKHRVFLEQAAPTINWCLSHNAIITCNHNFWKDVKTCVHLHPIKLGSLHQQGLAMDHITRRNITRVAVMSW